MELMEMHAMASVRRVNGMRSLLRWFTGGMVGPALQKEIGLGTGEGIRKGKPAWESTQNECLLRTAEPSSRGGLPKPVFNLIVMQNGNAFRGKGNCLA